MFWLAVRADGIASVGVTVGCVLAEDDPEAAPGEPPALGGLASADGDGDAAVLADGLADAVVLANGLADALVANSDVLAGTSLRKDLKIWLSCGWVHSTLAVS